MSVAEGRELASQGITRADDAANAEWKAIALRLAHMLAMNRDEFTTDPLWNMLEKRGFSTHEPRAMTGVLKRAISLGWIKPKFCSHGFAVKVPSSRKIAHAKPTQVYQSLLRVKNDCG